MLAFANYGQLYAPNNLNTRASNDQSPNNAQPTITAQSMIDKTVNGPMSPKQPSTVHGQLPCIFHRALTINH
eukprot:8939660-Lingulodinium_polyedra.AAC.1